ncbi:class A beta-lactamase-related serine hydrolase [Actinacidiphila glaucinigra]|uniref:serine hydrolase n=1 Tax=Actinacidiphila glaucinigra TaxID=235986 RepID=UPI002DDAF8C9|nr:serine hydrolase [Actinacidiphila glaucinigra]WSD64336.1 class A beta-lactamase-related serine hydrolase [Actinacidiphila glaucinigra]
MGHTRISRRAVAAAVVAGVAVPVAAGAATAEAASATPRVSCASAAPGLAAELQRDITKALAGGTARTAVSLHDRTTGTACTLRADQHFDSASTVKVTVLATLLRDAQQHHRHLTSREAELATAMITKSDNDATTALWKQLGVAKVDGFLAAAGMNHTAPGGAGAWGLTQITAGDEQKLMDLLTTPNAVLGDNARAYALKLMSEVVPSQRWGTPAGAPDSAVVHVKNGWLSRATHGWRVHSLGAFTGGGHDYTITVLTDDDKTMASGIATIQAVSRAIHQDLDAA